MLRHFSRNRVFFQIINLGNSFESFDQKVHKNINSDILAKKKSC